VPGPDEEGGDVAGEFDGRRVERGGGLEDQALGTPRTSSGAVHPREERLTPGHPQA
jgi:hypothetical protein